MNCAEPDITPFDADIAPQIELPYTLFHFAEVVPKSIVPFGTKFVVKIPNAEILSLAALSPK